MTMEKELEKYNRIKIDLLKMAQFIDDCTEKSEKEFYQNICIEYSKELKKLKKSIESTYEIQLCKCCIRQ